MASERACMASGKVCECWGQRKRMLRRFGVHYESLPHSNCIDPRRCDCECHACMQAWVLRNARPAVAHV